MATSGLTQVSQSVLLQPARNNATKAIAENVFIKIDADNFTAPCL
jgi:hypothetical protein